MSTYFKERMAQIKQTNLMRKRAEESPAARKKRERAHSEQALRMPCHRWTFNILLAQRIQDARPGNLNMTVEDICREWAAIHAPLKPVDLTGGKGGGNG